MAKAATFTGKEPVPLAGTTSGALAGWSLTQFQSMKKGTTAPATATRPKRMTAARTSFLNRPIFFFVWIGVVSAMRFSLIERHGQRVSFARLRSDRVTAPAFEGHP